MLVGNFELVANQSMNPKIEGLSYKSQVHVPKGMRLTEIWASEPLLRESYMFEMPSEKRKS